MKRMILIVVMFLPFVAFAQDVVLRVDSVEVGTTESNTFVPFRDVVYVTIQNNTDSDIVFCDSLIYDYSHCDLDSYGELRSGNIGWVYGSDTIRNEMELYQLSREVRNTLASLYFHQEVPITEFACMTDMEHVIPSHGEYKMELRPSFALMFSFLKKHPGIFENGHDLFVWIIQENRLYIRIGDEIIWATANKPIKMKYWSEPIDNGDGTITIIEA